MVFRYIVAGFASGAQFTLANKMYPEFTKAIMNKIHPNSLNLSLGVLSNAYTEKRELKALFEQLPDIPKYSDSGALQVLTRGLEFDEKMRKEVYTRQIEESDYCMSFDEMATEILDETTDFGVATSLSTRGRFFVDNKFQEAGKISAMNIFKQIQVFKENSTTPKDKILIILHGRSFETYREYAWFLFKELKILCPNYLDYCKGLAIGSSAGAGLGNYFDFMMRFQHEMEFVPLKLRQYLHILGAGGVTKIAPLFMIPKSYWLKDTIISSDSTRQSKAIKFGNFVGYDKNSFKREEIMTNGIYDGPRTQSILTKIYDEFKTELKIINCNSYTDFQENFTQYNSERKRVKSDFETDDSYHNAVNIFSFLWASKMIIDLFSHLEASSSVNTNELQTLTKWPSNLINLIKNCNKHSDYITETISGHPYKGTQATDKISDGELSREIFSYQNGHRTVAVDGSVRSILLTSLTGLKQKTIKRNTDSTSLLEEFNDEEW